MAKRKWNSEVGKGEKSKMHLAVRDILKSLFPLMDIQEEYHIKVTDEFGRSFNLYFDFYIPNMRTVIECQGEQHFKYSAFFHGSSEAWRKHRERDEFKKRWCEINNVTLVEVKYDEDITIELILDKLGD